jgi:3D (Asp-Asp-Asp) domain-containing protein
MVDRGICAVDPEFIPLGTRFVVPGYGLCVAADVGGGIKGWKVDLGFPEDAGPNPWRTGNVEIYILD